MKLIDICYEIVGVWEGLTYGEISFSYDNLMSAMKPGHPADILDEIISDVGFDVMEGKDIEKERLEHVLLQLEEFKECFKVKELSKPIEHLSEYLKENK